MILFKANDDDALALAKIINEHPAVTGQEFTGNFLRTFRVPEFKGKI